MRNVEIDNLVKSQIPRKVAQNPVMNLNASKLIADYDKIIDIELTGTFVATRIENIKRAEQQIITMERELSRFLTGANTQFMWSNAQTIKDNLEFNKKIVNNSKYTKEELYSINSSRGSIIQVLSGGNDPTHIFRAIDPSQNASFYEMIKKMSFYRSYELGKAIKKGKADEVKRLQAQQEAISFAKNKANEQNAKDRRELQDKVNKAMRNDPDSSYGRIVDDMQKEIAQARTAPSANSVYVGLIGGGEIHQDTDDDTNVSLKIPEQLPNESCIEYRSRVHSLGILVDYIKPCPKDEDIIPTATGIGTIALIGGLGYLLYRGIK
jgi:hypothetical protein